MGTRKDIKKILEILNEINSDTLIKAKKYVELKSQLDTIKFSVKSKNFFINEVGDYCVKVEYEKKPEIITFDDKGDIVVSDTFKNINLLNLISFQEMEEIQNFINAAKEKNIR